MLAENDHSESELNEKYISDIKFYTWHPNRVVGYGRNAKVSDWFDSKFAHVQPMSDSIKSLQSFYEFFFLPTPQTENIITPLPLVVGVGDNKIQKVKNTQRKQTQF